jgi:hypothetical protein
MNPLIQSKNTTILPVLIALTLGCFGLSPQARAVCQEGCLTNNNTVLGDDALLNNTGPNNTAIGNSALNSNTTGSNNTAVGFNALLGDTIGERNTAVGSQALITNTTGGSNTAIGYQALFYNTTGGANTANGDNALAFNTTGDNNTAVGFFALNTNTTGFSNTATGVRALWVNTTGSYNTAVGQNALQFNTSGSSNIAVGFNAGSNLITGSNNIDIGNVARGAGESRTIRIGTTPHHMRTFVAGISGVTVAGGVGVIVDTNGQLGTVVSSERFKDAIKPMDKASEAILALKPVTFRYKHELDPDGVPQFGLVAEDVEKVNSDLVARDEQGKPYTVRYEAVNAMLLNEFLKEHRKVEQQRKDFEAALAQQQKQIEALTAGLQKVSADLELSKSAPRTIANNQ